MTWQSNNPHCEWSATSFNTSGATTHCLRSAEMFWIATICCVISVWTGKGLALATSAKIWCGLSFRLCFADTLCSAFRIFSKCRNSVKKEVNNTFTTLEVGNRSGSDSGASGKCVTLFNQKLEKPPLNPGAFRIEDHNEVAWSIFVGVITPLFSMDVKLWSLRSCLNHNWCWKCSPTYSGLTSPLLLDLTGLVWCFPQCTSRVLHLPVWDGRRPSLPHALRDLSTLVSNASIIAVMQTSDVSVSTSGGLQVSIWSSRGFITSFHWITFGCLHSGIGSGLGRPPSFAYTMLWSANQVLSTHTSSMKGRSSLDTHTKSFVVFPLHVTWTS